MSLHHILVILGCVLLGLGFLLFLGGIVSAAIECHREKRETGTVTRPGWQRQKRDPARATPLEMAMLAVGLESVGMALVNRRTRRARARQGTDQGGQHVAR